MPRPARNAIVMNTAVRLIGPPRHPYLSRLKSVCQRHGGSSVEDLGCLVHMPGPDGEGWKLYLELAADYGRMTGNSDVTRLGKGCRPSDQNRPYMVRAINKYASPRRLDFGWCN